MADTTPTPEVQTEKESRFAHLRKSKALKVVGVTAVVVTAVAAVKARRNARSAADSPEESTVESDHEPMI